MRNSARDACDVTTRVAMIGHALWDYLRSRAVDGARQWRWNASPGMSQDVTGASNAVTGVPMPVERPDGASVPDTSPSKTESAADPLDVLIRNTQTPR
jgi:hypothetical protein